MPSCYAVGAEKALIQAALRACFSRGKGFIPKPSKSLFYCVTNSQQRSDEAREFSAKKLSREQKPSILKALASFKEAAKQLNTNRQKTKHKDRGIEL